MPVIDHLMLQIQQILRLRKTQKKLLEALYMFFKNLNQNLLGLAHLRQLSFLAKVKLICAEAIVLYLLLNSLQS